MSVAPLEPVKNAPPEFRGDNTVAVEFVAPMLVGVRCAERGAHVFGIPAMNSMGCGDGRMITMPNPCQTLTSGWYARLLCHELAHANGWSRSHQGGSYLPDEWAGVEADAQAVQQAVSRREEKRAAMFPPASTSPQAIAYEEAQVKAQAEADTGNIQIAATSEEQTSAESTSPALEAETEFSSRVQLASTAHEVKSQTVTVENPDVFPEDAEASLRPRTEGPVASIIGKPPVEAPATPMTTVWLSTEVVPAAGYTQSQEAAQLPPNASLFAPFEFAQ